MANTIEEINALEEQVKALREALKGLKTQYAGPDYGDCWCPDDSSLPVPDEHKESCQLAHVALESTTPSGEVEEVGTISVEEALKRVQVIEHVIDGIGTPDHHWLCSCGAREYGKGYACGVLEIGPSDPATQKPIIKTCPCEIVIAPKPIYSILNSDLCTPCFNTGLGYPEEGVPGEWRRRKHSPDCITVGCVDGKI